MTAAVEAFLTCSSRLMASGVPVPRATGLTLRDSRAETVQASISTEPAVALWAAMWAATGVWDWGGGEETVLGTSWSMASGGGTALKIAMLGGRSGNRVEGWLSAAAVESGIEQGGWMDVWVLGTKRGE